MRVIAWMSALVYGTLLFLGWSGLWVPSILEVPSAFAALTAGCFTIVIRGLGLSREERPGPRAVAYASALAILLAHPRILALPMRASPGWDLVDLIGLRKFLWSGFYELACAVTVFQLFSEWHYYVYREDVPPMAWSLVVPPVFFLLHWFLYPDMGRADLMFLLVVSIALLLLGRLYASLMS